MSSIYKTLPSNIVTPDYAALSFPKIWKALYNPFLDPEIRNISFKIVHKVLPTNNFLFQYAISNFCHCTFCGQRYVETVEHLFINCRQVAPVWFFVKSVLWRLCNHRLKVDQPLVIFNCLDDQIQLCKELRNVCLYLIHLVKYCVWYLRCQVKYEHRTFDGGSALKLFKQKLKLRIRVDYTRFLHDPDLFDKSWAYKDVLCSVLPTGGIDFKF